jgi:hypothetical protein
MKSLILHLAAVVFLLTMPGTSQAKPLKSPEVQGTIASINATTVAVKGPKGTRSFAIYPGTVFGQRAKMTLADFKPGDTVIVIFSEEGGKAKAENIRNPTFDKVKPAKKK